MLVGHKRDQWKSAGDEEARESLQNRGTAEQKQVLLRESTQAVTDDESFTKKKLLFW